MAPSSINLSRIVLADIWQHKWILLLTLIVVGNAMSVVYTSYATRKQTSQLDQLLQERDRLDIEWRNLLLEEQSKSEHSRVTRIATKDLKMVRPLPKEEVVIRLQ
ncbi:MULTISPECIES: cell division protein FtsL [unclassified Shewanella]|uniref:cell division protein FtsL n=1 Tax=unclassified Shewanella TaxID=196818 RepID=UPI000C83909A|nr:MULTISPECIES: cell division protein FtsL [unclassified Shewanella]MDO6618522.1 cell division protein FtsL [Shewanella sp. 6_MG-2023]MDO6640339.1 cell division protein FtsL [Shewanella sp. 5_MG-2023]MDO6680064.1 cell division protein FtsL [Shewanella sp. 4_MG-2023]MDO6774362.1 cell division protein FtsL [Shewanella sp. 3_MG-2023]PMG28836.1 cell division protein FtsL [Shewanella sp. 10N.286.52.C2]